MPGEIRKLQEEDLDELFAIRQVSFQDRSDYRDPKRRERHLERLPFTRGYFENGRLASALVMFPFTMHFAGKLVPVGGLASVQTGPEHRRKGYVRALLKDGLERLHDEGVGWCLEHPFDPFYYAKFGWQSVQNGYTLKLPSELFFDNRFTPDVQRVYPLKGQALPTMKDIYNVWAVGYNFTLMRNEGARTDWQRIFYNLWSERERFAYLLEDAYCILELGYEVDQETLHVFDYAFATPQGRRNLLAFWGQFYGQVEAIEVRLAGNDPLLPDLSRFLSADPRTLQARVVDVRRALEPIGHHQQAGFYLSVQDKFCDWNNQTFHLEFSDQGTRVEPSRRTADLSLDIGTLALLLSGSLSAVDAQRTGLIEGKVQYAKSLAALSGERTPFLPPADHF